MLKLDTHSFILEYKFDQARDYTKTVIALNFIVFFIFAIRGYNYIISHPGTLFSLFSGFLILVIYKLYDWRNAAINFNIILIYLILLAAEYFFFGIPGNIVQPTPRGMAKGFLLDLFMGLLPYLYIGLRVLAFLCLIPVWRYAQKISKV